MDDAEGEVVTEVLAPRLDQQRPRVGPSQVGRPDRAQRNAREVATAWATPLKDILKKKVEIMVGDESLEDALERLDDNMEG